MIATDIKQIITSLEQSIKDSQWSQNKVTECDRDTQDILHSIELDPLTKNERNKLATRLKAVRIERRKNKDVVEINEPVVTFLSSDKGRQLLNLLREVLGKTRKIEEYHSNRTYKPRVAKQIHG